MFSKIPEPSVVSLHSSSMCRPCQSPGQCSPVPAAASSAGRQLAADCRQHNRFLTITEWTRLTLRLQATMSESFTCFSCWLWSVFINNQSIHQIYTAPKIFKKSEVWVHSDHTLKAESGRRVLRQWYDVWLTQLVVGLA